MPRNTAIFYDIENLIKGYNFSRQMIEDLSLESILKNIKKSALTGQIAIQRAYANWSDTRLGGTRREINELGIDPIQVLGFSWDHKKNAADIQLAIDAIDLAHIRPGIEVFVIVSGDGGFGSLAKKLHEYGKTVIGCAYRDATNRIFESVCDEFIFVHDPEEEERHEPADDSTAPAVAAPPPAESKSDAPNVRLAAKIKPCSIGAAPEEVLAKAREVLNWYAADDVFQRDLAAGGLNLPMVRIGMNEVVPGFDHHRFGFAKFIEFLQCVCKGTKFCVARLSQTLPYVTFRHAVPTGGEVMPDRDIREVHSVEVYRSMLAAGKPSIRLPRADEMQLIVGWIAEHPPESAELSSIVDAAIAGLAGAVAPTSIKPGLHALVATEAFQRDPASAPLSEQKLTLLPDCRTVDALNALLMTAARQKLTTTLGHANDELLQRLFTVPASSEASHYKTHNGDIAALTVARN